MRKRREKQPHNNHVPLQAVSPRELALTTASDFSEAGKEVGCGSAYGPLASDLFSAGLISQHCQLLAGDLDHLTTIHCRAYRFSCTPMDCGIIGLSGDV